MSGARRRMEREPARRVRRSRPAPQYVCVRVCKCGKCVCACVRACECAQARNRRAAHASSSGSTPHVGLLPPVAPLGCVAPCTHAARPALAALLAAACCMLPPNALPSLGKPRLLSCVATCCTVPCLRALAADPATAVEHARLGRPFKVRQEGAGPAWLVPAKSCLGRVGPLRTTPECSKGTNTALHVALRRGRARGATTGARRPRECVQNLRRRRARLQRCNVNGGRAAAERTERTWHVCKRARARARTKPQGYRYLPLLEVRADPIARADDVGVRRWGRRKHHGPAVQVRCVNHPVFVSCTCMLHAAYGVLYIAMRGIQRATSQRAS